MEGETSDRDPLLNVTMSPLPRHLQMMPMFMVPGQDGGGEFVEIRTERMNARRMMSMLLLAKSQRFIKIRKILSLRKIMRSFICLQKLCGSINCVAGRFYLQTHTDI